MKKFNIIEFAIAGIIVLFSCNASAEKVLTADETKALFSGKTFDGYNEIKERSYKVYSAPDGTMIHQNARRTKKLTWEINGAGEHCAQFPKRNLCGKIVSMGDGVYHKINKNGKHTNTLKNFAEGNNVKLD